MLILKAITNIAKARREYHSFVSVRTLRDIFNNYELLKTLLRLEKNLVIAITVLDKIRNTGKSN